MLYFWLYFGRPVKSDYNVLEQQSGFINSRCYYLNHQQTPQFIKVSLIQMRLSVLVNLRHPAVSAWFMVGPEFLPNEVILLCVL